MDRSLILGICHFYKRWLWRRFDRESNARARSSALSVRVMEIYANLISPNVHSFPRFAAFRNSSRLLNMILFPESSFFENDPDTAISSKPTTTTNEYIFSDKRKENSVWARLASHSFYFLSYHNANPPLRFSQSCSVNNSSLERSNIFPNSPKSSFYTRTYTSDKKR